MEERFVIEKEDFKKLEQWADDIYNIAVVVDYFVSNQPEIEECFNLTPVIRSLRKEADLMNAFFINYTNGDE